ncbi:MAG: phosphatidylglycerophosphatase A [Syntrophobacterales bacterium]|nr:MAG: phosphatidylglycerophosphatase A [Syntrophobacterales bacterium]
MKRIVIFLATGCFAGYSPVAPGTAGTLVAIPIYFFLFRLSPFYYAAILLSSIYIAIWASDRAEVLLQSRDCRHIVIDEMVGFLVAMFMVPSTGKNIVLGFFLFRALDIVKPFPIRAIEEKVRGGYGVVLDDIVAGIYTNLIIHILRFTILKEG